ncbi:TetR/AcrR family transcriptional regulator [Fundidesulfovibrio butyratiphilus]
MPTLRERRKTELREKILQAAELLFGQRGYAGFSMRDLAETIGYSPTTLYLHFKDKDALLAEVCRRSFAELKAAAGRHRASGQDPTAALRSAMIGYVRFGRRFPGQYTAAFHPRQGPQAPRRPDDDRPEPPGEAPGMRAFAGFRSLVAAHLEARHIARDPEEATQCVWAALHGMTTLFITHPHFPWQDQDKLAESLADMLLAGLESPTRSTPTDPGGKHEP